MFIYDDTGLPFPKVNVAPLPSTANPSAYVQNTDWNAVCQALVDIQTFCRGAAWIGLSENSVDPAPAGVSNYLWYGSNGSLNITGIKNISISGGASFSTDFGTGTDGTATFDGTSTVTVSGTSIAPSAGVYTLPRTLYTNNATVNSGVMVRTNGYQWFDNGTLTNNGSVNDDGYNSGTGRAGGFYSATASASGTSNSILAAPFGASASGAAGGSAGSNGVGGAAFGGGGGGGGEGSSSAGGVLTAVSSFGPIYDVIKQGQTLRGITLTFGSGGGTGGVGTLGTTGIGGTGGGCLFVSAKFIAGTGTFSANGEAGLQGSNTTNGSQTKGGGGGGGGGGVAFVTFVSASPVLTGSGRLTANGGAGGSEGSGPGSSGGNGGAGGNGLAYPFNVSGDGS
jgi:hypothetical protein